MAIPGDLLIALSFYLLGAVAIAGAIGMIVARGIFRSALFLIMTLSAVAAIFVILGADFLGAVQVLIYVGAIMVLIIFGIMLTPGNVELHDVGRPGQTLAAILMAAAVFTVTALVVGLSPWSHTTPVPMDVPTTELIGRALFTTYALPFEIASTLLLIAMIGAIVIAREE